MKKSFVFLSVILLLGVGCKKSETSSTTTTTPTPATNTESTVVSIVNTYDPKGTTISCDIPPKNSLKDPFCIQTSLKSEFLDEGMEGMRQGCDEVKGVYKQGPCDQTKLVFHLQRTYLEDGYSTTLQAYLSKADKEALDGQEGDYLEDKNLSDKSAGEDSMEENEVKEALESINENFEIEFQSI